MHYTNTKSKQNTSRVMLRNVRWIFLFGLLAIAGCGTFDPSNSASRPWNRPTRTDVSQGWFYQGDYDSRPLTDYP
jgi:hypothetical protein